MNKLIDILLGETTYIWNHNIYINLRVDIENIKLKIVQIVLILGGWPPRTAQRVKKITMFKRFRRKILKPNKKFKGTK